nr:TetR/AcrR family transcriptional regulator [Eubacterium sp.]
MASRKEGYDERIIECAEKEFLEKGYNDASLRRIANSAGVSTSTIYTRFKD